jgi:lysophospholipase L1-like esterase
VIYLFILRKSKFLSVFVKQWKVEYFLPLVVILVCAVLIGFFEWGIHKCWPDLIFPESVNHDVDIFSVFDPRLGRWHRKNFSHQFQGTAVSINRNGLRGKDTPYENKNHRKRILVLGDSIAWGYGVNNGETFSDFLESRFSDTDVINMGITGYGTGEEMMLLEYEGLRYHPDMVILVFSVSTDVHDNLRAQTFLSFPSNIFYLEGDKLKIKRFKVDAVRRSGMWLRENSYFMNFLIKAPGKITKKIFKKENPKDYKGELTVNWVEQLNKKNLDSLKIDYSPYQGFTYLEAYKNIPHNDLTPTSENYYGVELTKKIILAMKRLVDDNKARLLIVFSPSVDQLKKSDYYPYPLSRELTRFCKEQGIDTVDLLNIFIKRGLIVDDIYVDGDGHFSVNGHREVADILYEEIFNRENLQPAN